MLCWLNSIKVAQLSSISNSLATVLRPSDRYGCEAEDSICRMMGIVSIDRNNKCHFVQNVQLSQPPWCFLVPLLWSAVDHFHLTRPG